MQPPASAADAGDVPVLTDLVEDPNAPKGATEALAREVFDRVVAEVEGRIAAEIEHRLARHATAQVQAALAGAVAELRSEIDQAIDAAVARALGRGPVK